MYLLIKRFFDILFSILLLAILFPLMLIISILILSLMGSPVFFRQLRIGKNNAPFSIFKFRTMTNKTVEIMSDKQRLTSLGRLLRKTSIDEYPQLFNIFLGHMSLIGPRPLLEEYIPYYNSREITRHKVRPGMSGLAQISGRSNLTWEEQFELDVQYVEKLSFPMDVKIFFKTIPKVLGSSDMMVIGRVDQDKFNIHRQKQIDAGTIKS
jgi:lipopolysaccharide/colanic/teichoic acid biosynthesis glycosyltransferase